MKKYFFYLIFPLLLNQYLSQSPLEITGCTNDDTNNETPCENRTPSDDSIYKCQLVGGVCDAVKKDCTEISKATEENCSNVSAGEKICYFSGSNTCNLATNCEDNINYHTSTTEDFCSKFDSGDNKCVNEGNTCVFKHLCKETKKTSNHDCSFSILEDSSKFCVLKIDSSTDCEEVTAEEFAERNKGSEDDSSAEELCQAKTKEEDCTLIFRDNIFIQCKWETDKCVLDKKYDTCASASNLGQATNEQCMSILRRNKKTCVKGANGCLDVDYCEDIKGANINEESCKSTEFESYQDCIKETNGCKLITKSCTDTTVTNFENDCEMLLTSDNNYKCYYDGEKCAQANSCASVAETKLTDNEKMKNICDKFNDTTKVCIPNGKKCALKDKGEVEEDTKDTKDDSSSTKVESSTNSGSDSKDGSDTKEASDSESSDEAGKKSDENTDKKSDEKENDDEESSSSLLLTSSFAILVLILL